VITGAQIREARALLGWSRWRVARLARLTTQTIQRAERVDGEPPVTIATLRAIKTALEAAGVEFTNADAPEVRLTRALSE
jgi:transcriptional regulator with XRE-family HTH domain